MAYVRVEQRNARLAGPVRVEVVKGRDGEVAKGTVTIISNTRRGSGDDRTEESTAIQWTLWGKQAENAAEYLGKGSHVNIVGRLRNNNYEKDGATVYGMAFTADEIDYLDSRADSEARHSGTSNGQGGGARSASASTDDNRPRKARSDRASTLTSA
jgi:single stranded DNA-binding protein